MPPKFNTEVTEMLRVLRVEGLTVAEYTEPLPGDDLLIRISPECPERGEGARVAIKK